MSENMNPVDQDDVVNEPVESAAAVQEPAEQPEVEKKPGWFKRFMAYLFNTDTRLGRFNKSFLRLLVAMVVLFAAGVLVTYFMLYLPARIQLTDTTAILKTNTTQLQSVQKSLDESDAALSDMTTAYDQLTMQYAYTTTQNQLLRVYGKVVDAQMQIKDKDYTGAKKTLTEARTILDAALPEMKKANAEDADRLDSRLNLVISEFGNDVKAAESDLTVMVDWIGQFDQTLQQAIDK